MHRSERRAGRDGVEDGVEARLAAQRIEGRVDGEERQQPVVAVVDAVLEIVEGARGVAEGEVGDGAVAVAASAALGLDAVAKALVGPRATFRKPSLCPFELRGRTRDLAGHPKLLNHTRALSRGKPK